MYVERLTSYPRTITIYPQSSKHHTYTHARAHTHTLARLFTLLDSWVMEIQTDGPREGRMDGRMDGRIDGRMNRRVNGWTDRQNFLYSRCR